MDVVEKGGLVGDQVLFAEIGLVVVGVQLLALPCCYACLAFGGSWLLLP